MAITRSQQAKQMLQDGGMLVKPSTDGKRLGYRSARAQEVQGRTRDTGSDYGQFDRAVSRSRNNPSRTTPSSDGGGDNKVDVGFQEALRKQKIEKKKKEARDEGFRTTGSVKYSPPTAFQKFKNERIQNAINRNKYLALQKAGLIPGGGFKGFIGSTIDGLFGKVPENLQDLTEEELTELAFEVQKFKDAGGPINQATYNPNLDVNKKGSGLELLSRTFDAQDLLDSGKMTQTKFEELFPGPDIPKGRDGPSDPCKGPNPPAYCFIGDKADDTQEDVITRNLAGLTPRMGGSIFDFSNMAEGGLADMDREAFLLGGIAKGLKKAVRGVKKLAKSPLGKAALIGAGFGLAGMGPFKGLANTGFGKGLAGLRGTLFGQAGSRVGEAFVPYKEGLFTKLGLTKGGGSLIPTLKGGITLAAILPLLVGKTDEEKDDILKDYYASQKLEPATTARQAGSEFDFYNYNLAEGGTPRKEPVAKKVMPLLDMGGMEKDYRAEGGFVPIGRMEKADDVPARLSKNEFVFTADAVRNAGDGDVDKGAEVMYNMMKNLEAGGEVSEESQGLDGARKMFQTSQRLGEVI